MMDKNYGAVFYGPNDIRVEELPIPEINDNEVLIKMASVGICGSDVKIYTSGRCGSEVLDKPTVLGHEGAGYVVKVGARVSNLRAGDRVAVEPTQPCRACAHCRRGRYNVCARPAYCGTKDAPGCLAKYYKHVADFCHKVPENLCMDEAAAVQPLAIAVHACGRAGAGLGTRVAVLGAGPVGLLCALTAKAMGATHIVITDVVQSKLDTAKAMGVDHTLLISPDEPDHAVVNKIVETLGEEPDITIDACGFASAQRIALMVTTTGGTVMVVGIGEESVRVPLTGALMREVDVRGSFRIANTYPAALAAAARGLVPLKQFITHHYALKDTNDAFLMTKSGAAMKTIIHLD